MSHLFWLTEEQMARLQPCFPKSDGRRRVDDRRRSERHHLRKPQPSQMARCAEGVRSLQDALYRWKRWGDKGIFLQMMEGLAMSKAPDRKTIVIDATYLKAHRTASSLREKRSVGRLIGRTKGGMNSDAKHELGDPAR